MHIETGSATIYVEEHGSGEPLILIHGLGMSHALWTHQVGVFAEHYRTIAVDLRGFGASSKPDTAGAYAVDALADDIAAIPGALGLESAHVLGTSMGGFVALSMALRYPERCRSLLLCHTGARMSIPPDVLRARVERLESAPLRDYAPLVVEQALAPGAPEELQRWVAAMVERNDQRAYVQVLTEGLADFDVSERVAAIAHPTLVVIGELDRVIPPGEGRALAAAIPGARLEQIDGVGHLGYAERPERFNQVVLDFLAAHSR